MYKEEAKYYPTLFYFQACLISLLKLIRACYETDYNHIKLLVLTLLHHFTERLGLFVDWL